MILELFEELHERIMELCGVNGMKCLSLTSSSYNKMVKKYLHHTIKVPDEHITDERMLNERLHNLHHTVAIKINPRNRSIPRSVFQTMSTLRNLKHLHLSGGWRVQDSDLELISGGVCSLKVLDLSGSQITSEGCAYLTRFHELKKLALVRCRYITPEGFSHISRLAHLVELSLRGCVLGDVGFAHICSLGYLRKLSLPRERSITDGGFSHIERLQNLQDLDLLRTRIGDEGFTSVCSLTTLKRLNVSGCYNISKDQLCGVEHLCGMEELRGSGCAIDDQAFASICRLTKLKVLDVSDCVYITPAGLAAVSSLVLLEELDLRHCPQGTLVNSCLFKDLVNLNVLLL